MISHFNVVQPFLTRRRIWSPLLHICRTRAPAGHRRSRAALVSSAGPSIAAPRLPPLAERAAAQAHHVSASPPTAAMVVPCAPGRSQVSVSSWELAQNPDLMRCIARQARGPTRSLSHVRCTATKVRGVPDIPQSRGRGPRGFRACLMQFSRQKPLRMRPLTRRTGRTCIRPMPRLPCGSSFAPDDAAALSCVISPQPQHLNVSEIAAN
jgi:hypothetical protein